MRIAIMGSGGVGGYFGARLAKGGADVHFVARGSHLAAMRERARAGGRTRPKQAGSRLGAPGRPFLKP